MGVEVITMANLNNSKTDVQQVKKQNQQSASSQGQFGTEFGSETDVQQVKKQNQSAEQNKQQNS
ncbi:gamma-type small acid-soluble spore protein [Pseudomonas sp. ISL-88]|nr:gamma-type small acid-soluble spore protein [Pseudomonas sp. ISL-88]